jgi:predicted transcriptional regulator
MAKANKKYSVADFRLAIERAGASPAAIAKELACTRGTVYSYLKRVPELKAAYEQAKGGAVEDKPQYPKEVFEKAIKESHGIKAAVMAAVGCSRQTVDNAFERWPDLKEKLDVARAALVSNATSKLVQDVNERESKNHFQAYMFVLKTFGKDEGFVERSEVTGADGAALMDVSPDVLQSIKDAGLNVAEVLKNFAAMVQAGAA